MCQASLGDLNQRMEQPISVFDFRPNVFVNNKNPYEEVHM